MTDRHGRRESVSRPANARRIVSGDRVAVPPAARLCGGSAPSELPHGEGRVVPVSGSPHSACGSQSMSSHSTARPRVIWSRISALASAPAPVPAARRARAPVGSIAESRTKSGLRAVRSVLAVSFAGIGAHVSTPRAERASVVPPATGTSGDARADGLAGRSADATASQDAIQRGSQRNHAGRPTASGLRDSRANG